ncbi:MAG: sulfatase [Kofleriaceae bacterium]
MTITAASSSAQASPLRRAVSVVGEGVCTGLLAAVGQAAWGVWLHADLAHRMPHLAALRVANATLDFVPPAVLLSTGLAILFAVMRRLGRAWARAAAVLVAVAAGAAIAAAANYRADVFPLHWFSSRGVTVAFAGIIILPFATLVAANVADAWRAAAGSVPNRAAVFAAPRWLLARVGLAALALVIAGRAALGAWPAAGPSVLVVSIDTLRADRLGVLGGHRDLTPNLDRLAREGAVFEAASSTAPWTLPAHVSLFLSQLPWDHGMISRGTRVSPSHTMLAEYYLEHAYRTAAFTAGGYVSQWYGFDQGFDTFEEYEHADGVGTEPIVAATLRWIRQQPAQPFFAFVHTYAAHAPYTHAELADPKDAGRMSGEFTLEHLEKIRRGELVLTETERRYVTDLYDGGVAYADRAVGHLFDELRRDGTLDRTIVVVVSDHGEDLWDHVPSRSPDHAYSLYEELIHVPLIVRAPGLVPAGIRIRTPVSLLDVAPTLLALSGLPADPAYAGQDLAESCRRGSEPTLRPVYAEATWDGPERFALRVANLKLIASRRAGPVNGIIAAPLEIFDLARDAHEGQPMWSAPPDASAARWVDVLEARATRFVGGQPPAPNAGPAPPEIEERLRNLGYVE